MTNSLALDSYFDRLQWGGDTRPRLATLAALLTAHMCSVPFENFDVLLKRPVRLDIESIQDKLVRARRGGYCFEHTILFAAALEKLGFEIRRHSARVVLFFPRTESPRAHMFLTVKLPEGMYVVDPGFGGPAALFPIPLVDAESAPPPDATHWMMRDGDYWVLRARTGDKRSDAWVSTLEADNPVDFEVANHFTATHPRSPFVNRIMAGLFTRDGRVTIMNRDFTVRRGDEARTGQFNDRAELRTFVSKNMGFDLPEIEQLHVPAIPEWG